MCSKAASVLLSYSTDTSRTLCFVACAVRFQGNSLTDVTVLYFIPFNHRPDVFQVCNTVQSTAWKGLVAVLPHTLCIYYSIGGRALAYRILKGKKKRGTVNVTVTEYMIIMITEEIHFWHHVRSTEYSLLL